jgi:hypothetical protein
MFKPYSNDVRERKNHFKTSQSDAFAAPGFRLASGIFSSTAESGLKNPPLIQHDIVSLLCEFQERRSHHNSPSTTGNRK